MMKLKKPVEGVITSKFGWRLKPKAGFHSGLDIACKSGDTVRSAYKGEVIFAGPRGRYGITVILYHPSLGKVWTLYAHLEKCLVAVKDKVQELSKIALADSTGYSTGNHLHFEVRVGANAIICAKDPLKYLVAG